MTTETMEKRFEGADFLIPDEISARAFKGHSELVDWNKLKQFVCQEILLALQNARESTRVGMKPMTLPAPQGMTEQNTINIGYNSALAEIDRKWEELLKTN